MYSCRNKDNSLGLLWYKIVWMGDGDQIQTPLLLKNKTGKCTKQEMHKTGKCTKQKMYKTGNAQNRKMHFGLYNTNIIWIDCEE